MTDDETAIRKLIATWMQASQQGDTDDDAAGRPAAHDPEKWNPVFG